MRAFAPRAWCTAASFGVLAFWGGMLMAGRRYPSEYDWRYMTISSLVYGDRNPNGYLWARAGIVLCGLAGLYWTMGLAPDKGGNRALQNGPSESGPWDWAIYAWCAVPCCPSD